MDWKNEEGRIFSENENGELMAEATYEVMENGELNIEHTFVNPSLRGQGIADKMMVEVAMYLRKSGKKAIATCTYADLWFKKNEEKYADVISNDFGNQETGCKIDGRH
jgi:predicted GNAT family acetyltransferase